MTPKLKGRVHVVIGDTQVKDGVLTNHMTWVGRYIVDQFWGQDVSLIHLGDHYDMPSLSSYDKGKRGMEGRRYKADIRAGNRAWELLNAPLFAANKKKKNKSREWWPDRHFLLGNHEHRIVRATEADPQLEGVISYDDFNVSEYGWKVHGFREICWLDGIAYSHFFYDPRTGRPYGGAVHSRLPKIGHSFTMGHQQGRDYYARAVAGGWHHGLVLGSTYLHDEDYLGPQGNNCWRGIVVKHQVERGSYDLMAVSLDYLCRRYERRTLAQFVREKAAA